MSRRLTRRFTYSNVIASMALFMALGGVGYAAATVDSSSIVNNSVRGKDIHQRTIRAGDIRTNGLGGKQIKESKLGPVPDAQALQGIGPEGFVSAGTLVRYSFTLNGGETREVAASGALKLTAHCIDNGSDQDGNPGKDVARIYASTTQDGSVLRGIDTYDGGASGYLNAATAETDAVWSETPADDGVVRAFRGGDDDLAVASAPDGATITGLYDPAVQGVNVFGAPCVFRGWAIVQ